MTQEHCAMPVGQNVYPWVEFDYAGEMLRSAHMGFAPAQALVGEHDRTLLKKNGLHLQKWRLHITTLQASFCGVNAYCAGGRLSTTSYTKVSSFFMMLSNSPGSLQGWGMLMASTCTVNTDSMRRIESVTTGWQKQQKMGAHTHIVHLGRTVSRRPSKGRCPQYSCLILLPQHCSLRLGVL